jgi:hypothetical protein
MHIHSSFLRTTVLLLLTGALETTVSAKFVCFTKNSELRDAVTDYLEYGREDSDAAKKYGVSPPRNDVVKPFKNLLVSNLVESSIRLDLGVSIKCPISIASSRRRCSSTSH